MIKDGIPGSHDCNTSGPSLHVSAGSQHPTQADWRNQSRLLPTYCFCDGKTVTEARSALEITLSGKQFIRNQKENEYNKALVRKDSSGEGKSHTDNGRRSVPPLDSSREIPGSELILCLSSLEEQ